LTIRNITPRRFLLQTGAKHYSLHLGPPLSPEEESDPRFAVPNFYFPQEDVLWAWAKKQHVEWTVTRPGFIVGEVPDAAMNMTFGLAVYAAVQAELGSKLEFPSSNDAWYVENHMSYAPLIGYHAEWAVLTSKAANCALNESDGSMFSWGKLWPRLAAAYGIEYTPPEQDESKLHVVQMLAAPPPRGFGPAGQLRLAWTFETWAKKKDVADAWKRLKQKHMLTPQKDPFENIQDVFGLLDAAVLSSWGRSMRCVLVLLDLERIILLTRQSVTKNRQLGWNGFVDTNEGIFTTIRRMSASKMIPPPVKTESFDVHYIGY
jgi:hypothetical protein